MLAPEPETRHQMMGSTGDAASAPQAESRHAMMDPMGDGHPVTGQPLGLEPAHGGQSNPHPWPTVGMEGRQAAIQAAARDCRAWAYTAWHAVLAITDWNRYNTMPSDPVDVVTWVTQEFVSHESGGEAGSTDRYLHYSRHWGAEIAPREWLIPGVLPAGQRCALVGRWGLGKSWLATHIATCVAYGEMFLGDTAPSLRGSVVILDGEGGRHRFLQRMNALTSGINSRNRFDERSDVHWLAAGGCGADLSKNAGSTLFRELKRLRPKLIIFDTLAKVMGGGDENSNAWAADVTRAMNFLGQELESALLLLAHPAKTESGDTSVRGAGEFTADVDLLHVIRKGANSVRTVKCHKDRDGDLEERGFSFSVNSGAGRTRLVRRHEANLVDPVERGVLEALSGVDSGLTRSDICRAVQEEDWRARQRRGRPSSG